MPFGIISLWLIKKFIEDPPYARKGKVKTVDYWGFILLIIWLFVLQIILDNGKNPTGSAQAGIRWSATVVAITFVAFIIRELVVKEPIVDLKVFKDKNFSIGTVLHFVIGAVLYSTLAILPLFLQQLMGYTATLSGLAISPRGFGSLTGLVICAILANRVDQRWVIAAGMLYSGFFKHTFGIPQFADFHGEYYIA